MKLSGDGRGREDFRAEERARRERLRTTGLVMRTHSRKARQ